MRKFTGPGGAHLIGFGFGKKGPLLVGADQGGGSAGGSAGGAGGEGGEGGGEGSLSESARKEVSDMVNQAVNGAVTNHLTKFKKTFTEEITGTLNSTLSPISEQLKLMLESQKQAPQGGGRQRSDGELPQEVKDSLLRNEARIKELEAQNAKERQMREEERATRLREEERGKLAMSLRERGIPDAQVKAAVAVLHTEDKRVGRDDDGRIVFRTTRGTGQGQYVDEMDLDKGVDEWLKTDEGKAYVPARSASGSGGQPARPGQAPRTAAEAKAVAASDLAKMLLGG